MSINWVMIHQTEGFVRLPGEKILWKSSPRTSVSITTPRTYPGNNPFTVQNSSGTLYLTTRRVVYLPATPTAEFRSFSAPLLNLHDSHVTVPWFGPNAWQAILQPVPGGNIPAGHSSIEIKFTFKEGGATDFHSHFERIKERFQQAVEAAQGDGLNGSRNAHFTTVNLDSVHLDQLPTYEASGHDRMAPLQQVEPETGFRPSAEQSFDPTILNHQTPAADATTAHDRDSGAPHVGEPPGYEETQQQSVQEALERRLMEQG